MNSSDESKAEKEKGIRDWDGVERGGWLVYKEKAWGDLTAERARRAESCEKKDQGDKVGEGRRGGRTGTMGRRAAKRGLGRRRRKGRGKSPCEGFSRSSCLD